MNYNIKYLVIFENYILEPDWAHAEYIDTKEEWEKLGKLHTHLGVLAIYEYKYDTFGYLQKETEDLLSGRNFIPLRLI